MDTLDVLNRYVPVLLRRELCEKHAGHSDAVRTEPLAAATLFIDITGFTSLSERSVMLGAAGVELLHNVINQFLSELIELIALEGGDVIAFAGDALMAVFPAADGDLSGATLRAGRCALAARALRCEPPRLYAFADVAQVQTRITLAAGRLWLATFGRPGRRRHFLLAGDAIERLARAHGIAAPNEVAASDEAAAMLATRATIRRAADGIPAIIEALEDSVSDPASPAAIMPDAISGAALRQFVPVHLLERIESGQLEWLAELRFVSAIFISLLVGDMSEGSALARVAEAVLAAEDEVVRLEGNVLEVRADDKGTTMIVVFGTPGATHEDDPKRAILAASAAREALARLGIGCAIGVASRSAFCGIYGNARRQEYAILGDVMTLAARLMQHGGGFACDSVTRRRADGAVEFVPLEPLALKGFLHPIQAFRVATSRKPRTRGGLMARDAGMVGRSSERGRIEQSLQEFRTQGGRRIVVVEGEPGMGKSTLLRVVEREARARGLDTISTPSDRIERLTPYYAWREALTQILELPADKTGGGTLTQKVLRQLEAAPELMPFAPLLSDILPIDIPPNEVTLQMQASARATTIAELVLHLLGAAASTRRLLILFEDAHWLDSASWSLMVRAARAVSPLMIVIAMRPNESSLTPEVVELLGSSLTATIKLGSLSDEETLRLVARRLEVTVLPAEVARFIQQKSAGNPFFSEELALALRERGHLSVEQGICKVSGGIKEFARLELPTTLSATIRERIDRLTAGQQLLLKAASVIGVVFPLSVLAGIHPVADAHDSVFADLDATEQRSLTARVAADHEGGEVFGFRHAIIQEVAYGMLTPSQRRTLHFAVGEWYENTYTGRVDPWLPLLAHHFRAADDGPKALSYLGLAGEQALLAHANIEAVHFLSDALELEGAAPSAPMERAALRRMLAEAHLKLSNLAACRQHLLDALALMGRPVPRGRSHIAFDLGLILVRQALQLPFSRHHAVDRSASGPVALLAAQLHQQRAEVAYFEHDNLALLHGTFAGLNAAEIAGASQELASSYGTAGIVAGLFHLGWLARRYIKDAVDVAAAVGHAPTAAYVHHLACVYYSGVGEWQSAERAIRVAADGYRRVGDNYRWQSTRMILAYQGLHLGDFAAVERALIEADEQSIFPAGPLQLRIWFRTAQLAVAIAAGPPDPALVREVESLADAADPSQELLCRGFAADGHRCNGEDIAAREQAERGLAVLECHRATTYYSLFGIASIAGSLIALSANARAEQSRGSEAGRLTSAARRSCRALSSFAGMMPIAAPCSLAAKGRLRWLDGDIRSARRYLRRAVRAAARLEMKGVEAAARRDLDRIEAGSSYATRETGWA